MKPLICFIFLIFHFSIYSQEKSKVVFTHQADEYVGQEVWVQGKVVSMKLAGEEGKMNYLNLDIPYPDNIFTIVFTENYRKKMKLDLEKLSKKTVKFFGEVKWYEAKNGKRFLEIFNPKKLEIEKD